MLEVTTIGLDIAKSVFQVHGINDEGEVVVRQQLKRSRVLAFLRSAHLAWLALKPVHHRIIGRVNCRRLATLFD